MRTLAERFGFRPTKFIPNGCGAGITSKLVPDTLIGANFEHCCDRHDLAYHIGRGGFLGLFYAKPLVDWKLAMCIDQQFLVRCTELRAEGKKSKALGVFLLSVVVPYIYFVGITLLGWTPLTWPWKERPMPSHARLVAIAQMISK